MISRIQFVALLTLLVSFLAVPARANRVDRGASGNGVIDPNCVADITTNPACVQFTQLILNTAAHWENFSSGFRRHDCGVGQQLRALYGSDTTGPVTFQLTGPSVAFGSFMCGLDGDFGAIDSGMLTSLNNFCNTFPDPSQILNPNPDNPDGSNKVLFNFISSSNLPSEWVFYSTFGDSQAIVSSTVTAPEPSSMLLLGSGLLALCGGLRRRSKNASAA